jgi:hypothetical protein
VPANWSGNLVSAEVVGTGVNRKLFTLDEDYNPSPGSFTICSYNIGTDVSVNAPGVAATADTIIDYTSHWITDDAPYDLLVDRQGADAGCIYVMMCNYQQGPKCYKIDGSGSTCYWDTATVNPGHLLETEAIPWGFALSPDESVLYIHGSMIGNPPSGKDDFHLRVFEVNTQTGAANEIFVHAVDSGQGQGLGARGDLTCDDAGNIYFYNGVDPDLHIWSPPDGPNSHTSYSAEIEKPIVPDSAVDSAYWSLYL